MGEQRATERVDPVDLSVYLHTMHSIAEEMGAALRRTAVSPNIKERRDYSCAVFDGKARVLAMGDHMPVHLGSMPMSVEAAVRALTLRPGDLVLLNDPYAGGTHLPDITMVLPVFLAGSGATPEFFVAARAHHSDVGGMYPGSMGPAREIFQGGASDSCPPVRLIREGRAGSARCWRCYWPTSAHPWNARATCRRRLAHAAWATLG